MQASCHSDLRAVYMLIRNGHTTLDKLLEVSDKSRSKLLSAIQKLIRLGMVKGEFVDGVRVLHAIVTDGMLKFEENKRRSEIIRQRRRESLEKIRKLRHSRF